MKNIKVSRVHICDEKLLFGNPVIEVDIYGKGGYKNIINQLKDVGYSVITIPEYNEKIVKYANKCDIIVEDEFEYLPLYFERKFKKRFESFGPDNLGIIFEQNDARLGEKIAINVSKYCRFLTLPDYPRCRRTADYVLRNNGLQINLENTLEKVIKKCDIILNVKNLEVSSSF